MVTSMPVQATGRSEGDYWMYAMSMNLDDVILDGTMKMELQEIDTITVAGSAYEVYVIGVEGSLSGSAEVTGSEVTMTVNMTGFTYELVSSIATVKNDLNMVADSSIAFDGLTISTTIESQSVVTNSPPQLSGFDLETSGPGDSWDETILESSTETTWQDGVITDQDSSEDSVTYSIAIAGSLDSVTTDAGTFECLRITVSEIGGGTDILWYSSEVQYFVKEEMYEPGDTNPVMTVELTEYGDGGFTLMILIVVIGVVVLLVAVAILIVLLSRRRQPAQPVPGPQEPPPLVPPGPGQ